MFARGQHGVVVMQTRMAIMRNRALIAGVPSPSLSCAGRVAQSGGASGARRRVDDWPAGQGERAAHGPAYTHPPPPDACAAMVMSLTEKIPHEILTWTFPLRPGPFAAPQRRSIDNVKTTRPTAVNREQEG